MKTGRIFRIPAKISLLKDLSLCPLCRSTGLHLPSYSSSRHCPRRAFLCRRHAAWLTFVPAVSLEPNYHFQIKSQFRITTSMTGWVGKSATLSKLYCEWNEWVGRNYWVWELTSFGMQQLNRKKPAPRGAGLRTTNGFTELLLRYSAH